MKKSKLTLRCLCEAAIMIALAQILGYLKLYELPQGGSITLSMLPIFLFCSRWGFGPGMLASFAFSLLQLFLDGAYAWSWQSMLGDYIFAFTVLGFAGLFSKKRFGFFYGTLLGSALRFLVHYVVGATISRHAAPNKTFLQNPAAAAGFWFTFRAKTAILVSKKQENEKQEQSP